MPYAPANIDDLGFMYEFDTVVIQASIKLRIKNYLLMADFTKYF